MALRTVGAFAAGVVVGWAARSALGPTREAAVHSIALAHRAREGARRLVAEQREWLEDMLAEGRAWYDASRQQPPVDERRPPRVIIHEDRERAA